MGSSNERIDLSHACQDCGYAFLNLHCANILSGARLSTRRNRASLSLRNEHNLTAPCISRTPRATANISARFARMEACWTRCSPRNLFRGVRPFNPKLRTSILRSSMATRTVGALERKAYDALLLDAGGTLLQLAKPVEETYAAIGRKYGLKATSSEIKQGFRRAFAAPWPQKLRYQGDGRAFWRLVVSEATGCENSDYFEEVYEHFANGDAWSLPSGAYETICHLKDSGVKLAVVSNFDTRLQKLLKDLNVADLFDAIIISAEVGYEKPAPEIFRAALDQIRVVAEKAVHVGDDEKADKMGANAVGIDCWLWGSDVKTFAEIRDRILTSDPLIGRI